MPTPNVSGTPDFAAVTSAAVRHRYDLSRQDGGALETDLTLYGSRQFRVNQANVALVDLAIGPRTSPFGGWADDITIKPFVAGRYIAVNDYTTYWAWGSGLETTAPISKSTTAALTVFGRRREFVNNPDASTNSNSTGNDIASSLEFRTNLNADLTLAFASNYTRYIAAVASESYAEFGMTTSLTYRFKDPVGINDRQWIAVLSAGVARAVYDQPDPTVDPNLIRQQNDVSFGLLLGIPLDESLSLVSQTSYVRRDATIANYAYDAFSTLAGVSWRF